MTTPPTASVMRSSPDRYGWGLSRSRTNGRGVGRVDVGGDERSVLVRVGQVKDRLHPTAGMTPELDSTAEQPGDLARRGQAQPQAPVRSRGGVIPLGERIECPLQEL